MCIKKVIKDSVTENDGLTYCPVRIAGIFGGGILFLVFIAGWAWDMWITRHFDAMLFVTSAGVLMGTIIGTISGGIAVKSTSDRFGSVEVKTTNEGNTVSVEKEERHA